MWMQWCTQLNSCLITFSYLASSLILANFSSLITLTFSFLHEHIVSEYSNTIQLFTQEIILSLYVIW